jgi:hypothetical protein
MGTEFLFEDLRPTDERAVSKERMRKVRSAARGIEIDFTRQNLIRRRRCSKNPAAFLRTYFPDIYFMPFSANQEEMLSVLRRHIETGGGQQAIAAERGGGKTTIAKGMIVWGLVNGLIRWVPWIEANFEMAMESIEDIKSFFEDPHGSDYFRDDYPEIVDPIRALEGESRRCRLQTFGGKRTKIDWGPRRIILPTVLPEQTPKKLGAAGGIVQAFGAEKPLRGLVRGAIRPDLVLINDVETEETAKSRVMTESIQKNIEKAAKGLGGPVRAISLVILCTIIRRGCLADRFTDRDLYPQWNGIRQKMLAAPPARADLWDQYLQLRKQDQRKGSRKSEKRVRKGSRRRPAKPRPSMATAFYRKNRREMDRKAVVSNRYRFYKPQELSALQHCYNLIADMGQTNFECEYQNNPPIELVESEVIQPDRIADKLSGTPRGTIPAETDKVTAMVDVHDQRLFWSVVAWRVGFCGSVVDYGVDAVYSPVPGTMESAERNAAVDLAILEGLRGVRAKIDGYSPHLVLVDSGYRTDTIIDFCRQATGWMPSKGGTGKTGTYQTPKPGGNVLRIGQGFHLSWLPDRGSRLVVFSPDFGKKRVQEGFLITHPQAEGSISLFGTEASVHRTIAEHITAEAWNIEKMRYETIAGKPQNHWLDCMVGAYFAAAFLGVTVRPTAPQRPKVKLSDLQRRKRHGI